MEDIFEVIQFESEVRGFIIDIFYAIKKLGKDHSYNFFNNGLGLSVMHSYLELFVEKKCHYLHYYVHFIEQYLQSGNCKKYARYHIERFNHVIKQLILNHCNFNYDVNNPNDYINQVLSNLIFDFQFN